MVNQPIPVLAENLAQQRYLEAILHGLIVDGSIDVQSRAGRDVTLSVAEAYLFRRPGEPIALVLETNCDEPHKVSEYRQSTLRRLARSSRDDSLWRVAFAVPRLDAWALTDPRVAAKFAELRDGVESPREDHYLELAAQIGAIVAEHPFDLDNLKARNSECRKLCEFLEKNLIAEPAATR